MEEGLFAGRYRLEGRLGSGGMSEVWAAEDVELGRPIALKLLAPEADRERFRREARAVASVSHPNISRLYDYGEAEGRPYMVLERLSGGSLEERLQAGRLADEETDRIAREVAEGLAVAHARGLVHRDLKPANILFDDEGRAKIADFGVARWTDLDTLTEAGMVIGTAATISPEQAAGEPATPASDVYSFGVLLFHMLTGRPPFESDKPLDLLQLHRNAAPPAVEELRADAPAALAALADAALSKDPALRPVDGNALVRALSSPTSSPTVPLAPVPAPPPPGRRRRFRGTAFAGLGLAALAAAGAGLAFVLVHSAAAPGHVETSVPSLTLPRITTAAPPTVSHPSTTQSTESQPASTSSTATTATRRTTTSTRTSTVPPPPVTTGPGTTTDEGTTTDFGTTTTGTTTVVVSGP